MEMNIDVKPIIKKLIDHINNWKFDGEDMQGHFRINGWSFYLEKGCMEFDEERGKYYLNLTKLVDDFVRLRPHCRIEITDLEYKLCKDVINKKDIEIKQLVEKMAFEALGL